MNTVLSKKDHLVKLLQLAPLEEKERSGWMLLLPYMDESQIDNLVEILDRDVASFEALLSNTK